MPVLTFDLQDTSVSVPGALIAITAVGERTPFYRCKDVEPGVYLRSLRTEDAQGFLFHLIPTRDGTPIADAVWLGMPGACKATSGESFVSATFTSPTELVFEGQGLGLLLGSAPGYFDWIYRLPNQRWRYNSGARLMTVDIVPVDGTLNVDAPWDSVHSTHLKIEVQPGPTGRWRFLVRERQPQEILFDDSPAPQDWKAEAAFLEWGEPLVAGLPDRRTALVAAHILWAHQAGPDGLLTGKAILAGKSWMPSAYGWDQCFCAVAIAHADPDLAWEQVAIFFRAQRNDGLIPAFFHPDRRLWNTLMPPLQGWCLRRLSKFPQCVTHERLAWITPRLDAYVRWWLYRDQDGDGIPEYLHGNDSGWDNGTSFKDGVPVAGPDLLAYLVECCIFLAEAAMKLGDTNRAAFWRQQESRLVKLVSTRFIVDDRLVARRSPGGEIPGGDSLQPWLALHVGTRLPEGLRKAAIAALADPKRFLAPYGLATESLASPFLLEDGYWRGPVWAPTTWLLAEALERVGAGELAREVLLRFCKACAKEGMAENFDPVSGRGLRDRSYAWTAAVYILAQRHLHVFAE